MQQSFIFGGNTGLTYDQIQKQRDIANELLRANMYTPQNVGEGLSAIGRALAAKAIDKRTSRADAENRKAYEARRSEIFGMLGGGAVGGGGVGYSPSGTWTPAPPPPKPTDSFMGRPDAVFSGGNSFNLPATPAPQPSEPLSFGSAVMTPQEMLIEGAKARGLDPIDVATAISYETGGKFDPMIAGPTTQWGTHKGLIQFGEPQAQQHGVDFSSPEAAWRSQLDPKSGAVWSYLDSTGVQPGMGLDQIYSAINAGGINRFGASDANNGGAPGTVADKVAGMGPHREKAAQFLGGTWTPTGGQPVGGGSAPAGMPNPAILMALAETAGSPYASESDKMIAQLLMDQTIQAMDPMRQMEMERARLELDQMRNPQPGFRNMTDEEEIAAGLDPSGVYQQGREGNIVTVQAPAKPSVKSRIVTGEEAAALGLDPSLRYNLEEGPDGRKASPIGGGQTINRTDPAPPAGYRNVYDDQGRLVAQEPIPGSPAAKEAEAAARKAEVRSGMADGAGDTAVMAAQRALTADNERAVGGTLGAISAYIPETQSAEVYRQVDALKAMASIEALTAMRNSSPTGAGMGNPTDRDAVLLEQKHGALDPKSPNFQRDLLDYTRALLRTIHGQEAGDAIFEDQFGGTANGGLDEEAAAAVAADPAGFQAFAADPSAIAAAQKYGVTLEEMWAIKQGQK